MAAVPGRAEGGEGRRKEARQGDYRGAPHDGLKATSDELLAGRMRYAAAMAGNELRYIKHPTTWLSKGCWADEHGGCGGLDGRRPSASTEAVWAAGAAMAARSRRVTG